jgi:peptide chain release factor subunit 1
MDPKQKYKLRQFIKQLEPIKGRHTELVSVYIPAAYSLNKIIQQLEEEQGTASNIKDKTTRTHVISSLERMIRHLRLFKSLPENGLAVFSGNVAEREGQENIEIWSIEPPSPISTRMYRCDQTFQLDLLKEQLEEHSNYGLLVIDRKESTIGILKGNLIQELVTLTSGVPGKYKTGGQSAMRFARLREQAAKEFYHRIADSMKKEFFEMKDLKGLLIGGPGHTKEEFADGDFLVKELKNKIKALKDLSYTGDFGLKELVEKSEDVLAKETITKEKELVKRFFETLAKDREKAVYGPEEVEKALDFGAVDLLLVSESLDDETSFRLQEKAEKLGAGTELISIDTEEGKQLKALGKVGAILRFKIKE